jgi:hypothetical protein
VLSWTRITLEPWSKYLHPHSTPLRPVCCPEIDRSRLNREKSGGQLNNITGHCCKSGYFPYPSRGLLIAQTYLPKQSRKIFSAVYHLSLCATSPQSWGFLKAFACLIAESCDTFYHSTLSLRHLSYLVSVFCYLFSRLLSSGLVLLISLPILLGIGDF